GGGGRAAARAGAARAGVGPSYQGRAPDGRVRPRGVPGPPEEEVAVAATGSATKTEWHIVGEDVSSCNCAWGCPCQFDALPTTGYCEALAALDVERGHFGATRLDGVRFAQVFHWDRAVHEGNGWRRLILDER